MTDKPDTELTAEERRIKHALGCYGAIESMVNILSTQIDESEAKNYVAMNLVGFVPPFDRVELTFVRPGGQTPHERVAKLLLAHDTMAEHVKGLQAERAAWSCDAKAAAGLTVGAALADPRVQRGEAVVEYQHGEQWLQLGKSGVRRWCLGAGWLPTGDRLWLDVYALPARIVPLALAEADPSTRGALPQTGEKP